MGPAAPASPPLERLYRQMVRMRRFEEALAALWQQGLISGELHLGIGEEAIVAGVVEHLGPGDGLALDHRPTPALVGIGTDPALLILEMLGHEQGLCRGHGGRMHLFDPGRIAASSGIVGASGPMACGFALALSAAGPGRVAVAFFGEGAANQGMLMEALNLAVAWRLPVVFVCKDSTWAITTRSSTVTGGRLDRRAAAFGMPAVRVNGMRVDRVWRAAGRLIARARQGKGPGFLLASCWRPGGHFEGDPLVLAAAHPASLKAEVPGMLDALRGPGGGPARRRVAGLLKIGATVGRMEVDRLAKGRDPLRAVARRLPSDARQRIAAVAAAEIDAAVASARQTTRERP
jgi:acetoin:2,6-dichlorophenolindophenol oxidoreductase subunit alpha